MMTRKQQVEELFADLRSLRRTMAFRMPGSTTMPRVTPSQWGVLLLIEQQGESTVKEVAKALGISSSAATQLIDGLVESGYLLRQARAGDRRSVALTLSKKSKAKVTTMRKRTLQKFLNVFKALNDREFAQYVALNKKIVHAALSQKNH
jgi:DNA-binding MarR family transcriptional regulator